MLDIGDKVKKSSSAKRIYRVVALEPCLPYMDAGGGD